MKVTYTQPGVWDYDSLRYPEGAYRAPDPRDDPEWAGEGNPDRFITVEEPEGSTLHDALTALILSEVPNLYAVRGPLLVTTEGWWSGYSEFTITYTWSTVVVSAPRIHWERRWPSVADLFRDLASASEEAAA